MARTPLCEIPAARSYRRVAMADNLASIAYSRSDYLAGGTVSAADLFVAPILAGAPSM